MIIEALVLIARISAYIGQALYRWLVILLGTRTVGVVTESGQYDGYKQEYAGTLIPSTQFFVIYEFTAGGKTRIFRKQPTGKLAEVGAGSEIAVHFLPALPAMHVIELTPELERSTSVSTDSRSIAGNECSICRTKNVEGASFCKTCGRSLDVQGVYRVRRRRGLRFWLGVSLLVASSLFWLLLIIGIADDREDLGDAIIGGIIITFVPVTIGIFAVVWSRR